MPEELLDRAEVGAALEQVRRERVAELVRVRADPAERARVEPLAARGQEQRRFGTANELGARIADVQRDPVGGLLAERDHALLVALAVHAHELLLEVDVGEVEEHGFA